MAEAEKNMLLQMKEETKVLRGLIDEREQMILRDSQKFMFEKLTTET